MKFSPPIPSCSNENFCFHLGDYSFGFNGKDKESEFNSGAYDFGARIHDARLGRWMSVDGFFYRESDLSSYNFCADNPIFFVDPNGNWKVSWRNNNDHSAGIVLVAENGDNLKTLATQLGVDYQQLIDDNFKGKDFTLNNPLNGGEWLREEDLPGLETFQAVNEYLKRDDIQMTNCANAAMEINGIETPNAWENDSGEFDQEGGQSSESMNQAADNLATAFDGVTASEAKIGDIITYELKITEDQELLAYGYNTWDKSKAFTKTDGGYTNEYMNHLKTIQETYPSTDHYAIVLLKNKEGTQISTIFEKPGVKPAAITDYNEGDCGSFKAKAAPEKTSEIQSKK